jgi:hypothetical protein
VSEDDETLILNRAPANDNASLSKLDARLLGHALELLQASRDLGLVERDLYDALAALEREAKGADINGAIMDARRAGFVVLRMGRLCLERRLTQEQLGLVRRLARELGARGSK